MATVEIRILYEEACKASDFATTYLIENTRPSLWQKNAKGWQELWTNAPHAGLYASCDGVTLLANANKNYPRLKEIRLLAEQIYSGTIVPTIDHAYKPTTDAQRRVKIETRWITMKLAKILQASATRSNLSPATTLLIQKVKQWLLSEGRRGNGAWHACIGHAGDPSVTATAEALIALQPFVTARSRSVLSTGIQYLSSIATEDKDPYERIIALWALSELARVGEEIDFSTLTESIQNYLVSLDLQEEIKAEKFWNSKLNTSDYYSFNVGLITATTIINYMLLAQLSSNALPSLLAFISRIANNIYNNGRYILSAKNRDATFWENYQALVLLRRFTDLVRKHPDLKGNTYMYVNPKHFHKKTFVEEGDLCAVIMPLTTPWERDVFDAFTAAVTEKKFRIWRSDNEALDDAIMQTVWEQINRSRFIIADCTGKNPNVFYELGIAHTLGKPVFLCAQSRDDFPFDIAPIRSHEYGVRVSQINKLIEKIQAFIDNLQEI